MGPVRQRRLLAVRRRQTARARRHRRGVRARLRRGHGYRLARVAAGLAERVRRRGAWWSIAIAPPRRAITREAELERVLEINYLRFLVRAVDSRPAVPAACGAKRWSGTARTGRGPSAREAAALVMDGGTAGGRAIRRRGLSRAHRRLGGGVSGQRERTCCCWRRIALAAPAAELLAALSRR